MSPTVPTSVWIVRSGAGFFHACHAAGHLGPLRSTSASSIRASSHPCWWDSLDPRPFIFLDAADACPHDLQWRCSTAAGSVSPLLGVRFFTVPLPRRSLGGTRPRRPPKAHSVGPAHLVVYRHTQATGPGQGTKIARTCSRGASLLHWTGRAIFCDWATEYEQDTCDERATWMTIAGSIAAHADSGDVYK